MNGYSLVAVCVVCFTVIVVAIIVGAHLMYKDTKR